MKQIKREIFKKLSFAFIGIIFIPALLIGVYQVTTTTKNVVEKLEKDNYYTLTKLISELNSSFSKVEKIKLLIRGDFEFLTFLTSDEEKTAIEYTEFQRRNLVNYHKLMSVLREVTQFKIYVDNENLLEMRPLISSEIPEGFNLKDRTLFLKENGKNYLYYFRKIYFYPRSVYMEVKIDLETIIGKSEENYYFYKNHEYFNINSDISDYNLSNLLSNYKNKIDNKEFGIINNGNVIMYYSYSPTLNVHLFNIVSKQSLINQRYTFILIAIALILFALITIYFISYFVSIKLFKQLEYIVGAVKEIKEGNLDVQIPTQNKTNEFYMLSTQLNSMTKRIKSLIKENVERETVAKDFQIKALQSQINSHFMQNTIESIKMLAYINEDYEVSDALTNLGRILRYGMDWKNPVVTFEEEMNYLERYIKLFSFRIENEITFRYYIEDELLKREIPKMLIQPMVENSILHGIIPKEEPGFIQIRAYSDKNNAKLKVIEILDNGMGTEDFSETKGSGIGMENLDARLRLHFKGENDISVSSIEGKFTRIIVKIEEK